MTKNTNPAKNVKPVSKSNTPKKYHPLHVTLHWLIAIMIFSNVLLAGMSEEGGQVMGIPVINLHMIMGITILLLMFARLYTRARLPRPATADVGNAFLNKVGELTHWVLYLLAIVMPLTGIMLASLTDDLSSLIGSASSVLGASLGWLGRFHGLIWALLLLTLLLHIGAALFHQFIKKDNLFGRMWYGK